MKTKEIAQKIKSESELKRLEGQGVNVESLRNSLKDKIGGKTVVK